MARLRRLAANEESQVKKASAYLALSGLLAGLAVPSFGQTAKSTVYRSQPTMASAAGASSGKTVSRTTKAINYRRAGGSTKIDFQGTELMQAATGEGRVDSKSNRMEIEVRFQGLEQATKFG